MKRVHTTKQTVHVTFSLPKEVNKLLHSFVPKRGLSSFVSQAIVNALEEEQKQLKAEYLANEKDAVMKKEMKDWEVLDFEGWDE